MKPLLLTSVTGARRSTPAVLPMTGRPRLAARLAILLVRLYQLALGPFARGACRFEPSCSAYAREAIERHGAWRGLGLTFRRLGRCHPLGPSGYDPVP